MFKIEIDKVGSVLMDVNSYAILKEEWGRDEV